ncbi:SdpI family protein [Thermodesulfitimonas autotrophica]|uniref:SdpI family protein n=1 Tax=Thermodesulfitimonas autotrophica TaxID=1894989 RepID=UPI002FE3DFC9
MPEKDKSEGYALTWEALKPDWPVWVVLAGLLVAAVILYPLLPERVPVHWNWRGEVDRYGSRFEGAFVAPLLALGIYILMVLTPLIDPRRENYARFAGAYRLLRWVFVLFMASIYVVWMAAALGYRVDIGLAVKTALGLLFAAIGNVLGQVRHNYFVGIRTPWTLADEAVWRRTHRLAAKVWVVGGLVCLALAPFRTLWAVVAFFAALTLMVLVPVIFSYLHYRRVRTPDGLREGGAE